jgi:RNA-directed DNA polymerase
LVRYADDFVVMARYISPQLRGWIEDKLEGWLGLQINRDKTRILPLRQTGQSLDFLGYTFRYARDQQGRPHRYWNLEPSRKAMERERAAVRSLTGPNQSHTPVPELIGRINRHLRGWSNYFKLGYPRKAFRQLNHFVGSQLGRHLQRRSQRGWRAREGVSLYAHLHHLGLIVARLVWVFPAEQSQWVYERGGLRAAPKAEPAAMAKGWAGLREGGGPSSLAE